MFRLLLFLARGLKGIHTELAGIHAILARAFPAQPPVQAEFILLAHDPDAEQEREDAYSRHIGRPLFEGENVPPDFNPTDPGGLLASFLGKGRKGH